MEYEWSYLVLFFKTIELRIILNYGVGRNDIDFCYGSGWFWWIELLEVFLQVFEELFFPNIGGSLPKFFKNLRKNKDGKKF